MTMLAKQLGLLLKVYYLLLFAVSGGMKVVESWRFEIPSSSCVFFKNFRENFSSFFHFHLLPV